MNQLRTIGLALIIIGIIAYSYEGVITYQTRDKIIDAGSIQVTANKTHKLDLPPTLGALALISGVALLVSSARRA